VWSIADAQFYGDPLVAVGFKPLAVAVAGTEDVRCEVRVLKRLSRGWRPITYEAEPITWIPNPDQVERARGFKLTHYPLPVPPK